jgi:hypothetical protein
VTRVLLIHVALPWDSGWPNVPMPAGTGERVRLRRGGARSSVGHPHPLPLPRVNRPVLSLGDTLTTWTTALAALKLILPGSLDA